MIRLVVLAFCAAAVFLVSLGVVGSQGLFRPFCLLIVTAFAVRVRVRAFARDLQLGFARRLPVENASHRWVELVVRREGQVWAHDVGRLWSDDGGLHFQGLRLSFDMPGGPSSPVEHDGRGKVTFRVVHEFQNLSLEVEGTQEGWMTLLEFLREWAQRASRTGAPSFSSLPVKPDLPTGWRDPACIDAFSLIFLLTMGAAVATGHVSPEWLTHIMNALYAGMIIVGLRAVRDYRQVQGQGELPVAPTARTIEGGERPNPIVETSVT